MKQTGSTVYMLWSLHGTFYVNDDWIAQFNISNCSWLLQSS